VACNKAIVSDSSLLSKFSLPKFSRKTQECIEKCQIVKGVRTEIISSISWEIWGYTQYPSSEEYTATGTKASCSERHNWEWLCK